MNRFPNPETELVDLHSKLFDCYNQFPIFLMGSVATYWCLPPQIRDKYKPTAETDLDYFIIGNTVTGVDDLLLTEYCGLENLNRLVNPTYYKMPGLRKIYSYHYPKLKCKVNIIFLSPEVYTDLTSVQDIAMGHDLAKSAFIICGFDGYVVQKLHYLGSVIEYESNLLTNEAYKKLVTRATQLGIPLRRKGLCAPFDEDVFR